MAKPTTNVPAGFNATIHTLTHLHTSTLTHSHTWIEGEEGSLNFDMLPTGYRMLPKGEYGCEVKWVLALRRDLTLPPHPHCSSYATGSLISRSRASWMQSAVHPHLLVGLNVPKNK